MRFFWFLAACTINAALAQTAGDLDPLSFVDPLIGTNNGGNVFAGATLPSGMAKAVADVNRQNTGGLETDGSGMTGSSAMHDSGTGCNPSLGNFPIFPQICLDDVIDDYNFLISSRAVNYTNSSVKATPGFWPGIGNRHCGGDDCHSARCLVQV